MSTEGWAGAAFGVAEGAKFGFTISAWSGAGSVPCMIICGTIGGIAGSMGFSLLGTGIVDAIYGR